MAHIRRMFFLFLFTISLFAQQHVRVMSYNLHNYPNGQDANFKKVVAAINPDALVVVEMMQQSGVNQFLQNSLNTEYTAAGSPSIGQYVDCAFYYKSSVFNLISSRSFYAMTRDISEFKLVHKVTSDTLIIYGVHLKANQYNTDNTPNEVKRASAAQSLRNVTKSLPAGTNYLVCGDFNIFSSNEAAFQNLVGSTSTGGYFIDMMNVTGNWNGDSAFNTVCSYSSTSLNTRLDMVLVSQAVMDQGGIDYKEFKIFGNDGNHFNSNVSYGANTWFTSDASLGTAVTNASDHLPVYVDLDFGVNPVGVQASGGLPKQYELKQNYPNPFNPSTTINYSIPQAVQHATLKVYDLTGREVAVLVNEEKSPGSYSVNFDGGKLTSGVYFYRLQAGTISITQKMVFLK